MNRHEVRVRRRSKCRCRHYFIERHQVQTVCGISGWTAHYIYNPGWGNDFWIFKRGKRPKKGSQIPNLNMDHYP